MNIKELKAKIKDLPDNMDVMIVQSDNGFMYSLGQSAKVEEINFGEGDGITLATDKCLVISDDI